MVGRRTASLIVAGVLAVGALGLGPTLGPGRPVLAAADPACYDAPFGNTSTYQCLSYKAWTQPSGTGSAYLASSQVQALEYDPTRPGRLRAMAKPLEIRVRALKDKTVADCRIIVNVEFRWNGIPADKSIASGAQWAFPGIPFDNGTYHFVGLPDILRTNVKVTAFGWKSVVTMPTALTGRTLANATPTSWLDTNPLSSLSGNEPVHMKAEQSAQAVGWAPFAMPDTGTAAAVGTSSWRFREAYDGNYPTDAGVEAGGVASEIEAAMAANVKYLNLGRINTTLVRAGACPTSGLEATVYYTRTVVGGHASCSEQKNSTSLLSNLVTLATAPFSSGAWYVDMALQQAMSIGLNWVTTCAGESTQTTTGPTLTVLPAMY